MRFSAFVSAHTDEDLVVMRKAVARLAEHLGLDLSNADDIRRCLDGDFSHIVEADSKLQECHEMRDMLVLLLRLESSSSEDLGIDGLRRLWQRYRELMTRFYMREPLRFARPVSFSAGLNDVFCG